MSSSIIEIIAHYQRSIEKSPNDEARLLHCIEKLYKLPVTVDHLQQTGIGKTVNSLRKYDKEVGVAAKALVAKWKAMVAAEEEVMEEEAQKQQHYDDDPQDDNNSNSYNENQQQNTCTSENSRHSHNRKDSSRHEKNRDVNENERSKYKENRGENRDKQHQHTQHSHSRHSSSSDRKLNKANDRHNRDQKPDEKHKKIKENSDRKSSRLPKPTAVESSADEDSDEEVCDDDDEDDEKLVIDINKEKLEEEIKKMSRESHKTSKSSRSTSEKHHKESSTNDHSSSKRHKSDEKNKKDSSKKSSSSSSSKSHSSSSKTSSKDNNTTTHHHHQPDNKDTEKSSSRRNGEHKSSSSSSSSSSKRRADDKSKTKDEKPVVSKSSSSSSSNKRKRDSTEDSNADSEPEQKITPKKNKTSNKIVTDSIDSSMGSFSFEEALGMVAGPSTNSKSTPKLKSPKSNGTNNTNQSSASSSSVFLAPATVNRSKTPPLLTSKVKLEPLDPKIAFELPTISPNYKPMPLNPIVMDCVFSGNNKPQRRLLTDEEALCAGISSKTIRTKIYSGVRTGAILQVPSLFDLCIRVLQKNIDALEYTGGVPFEVLKPVLERATPEQLLAFEDFNPYLMEDTDELWKHHCGRRYKAKKREEFETWREMFLRCKEELEERLSAITKNINYSQKQSSLPIRKTQLAYVDVTVKPPRNVQRQQEQFGTKSKLIATPAARVAALSKMTPTIAKAGDTRLRVAADVRDFAQASSNSMRPKKAPLMQKTLQLMKGRFKR